ncbi:MAG: cupin domain-containing protein [Comamonadaceae bacterium]|nr:cupin domain-containing protein [Comamonadaceae bacterium]
MQRAALGDRLGLTKIGLNVTQVAPGRTAYPFHSHRANDELFFILSGRGELRLGSARHPVKEGDLIGCPVGGPETAHQLINTGTEPLRYCLSISTTIDPDVCEYPTPGKVGAYCGDDPKNGLMHLTRYADQVNYWEGE